jgi:PAS domain S-box-containing protein
VALGGAPDRAAVERVTVEAANALMTDAGDLDVVVHLGPAAAGRAHSMASSPLIEVPIASQGSDHGMIRVAGHGLLPAPIRAALEALGAQAAVALERAALADDLLRRRSDERMAAVVQQASDVIIVLDADLVIRYQTASAARFLAYEPAALTGSRFLDIVHPDDLPVARAFVTDLLARPGLRPETEFRFLSGKGTWVAIEALGNNLLADERVGGVVVTIRDLSKRKALETALRLQVEELKELDKIKTDLVSTVSHELRTPLTTVVGHVEMLADGDFGALSANHRWAVQAIQRNCLLTLIEDMLTLAKIENGGLGLAITPTDASMLLADVWTAAAPLAAAKAIDLQFDVPAGVPEVLADRSALERAVMNLVSNAVKFTPNGGAVRVSVRCDDNRAVFAVADTGIGMSAEDQERLFTRFFRSPAAMSMAIPGTGLGLAIVKKIVEDHGGTVDVRSAPARGTTVEFTIPLVAGTAGAVGQPIAIVEAAG